jgi:hypothetical protein
MFTTKTRTALAVAGATLGIVVPALPAQAAAPAQPPTRPSTLRLQGASTTVTVFRPAGTRNVYLRARTIKRTINGTIVRNVNRIPIWWTVTKPIILDGKVVAKVSAGATGQGASQATCERFGRRINGLYNAGAALYDVGAIKEGDAATQTAQDVENEALDAGCFILTTVA